MYVTFFFFFWLLLVLLTSFVSGWRLPCSHVKVVVEGCFQLNTFFFSQRYLSAFPTIFRTLLIIFSLINSISFCVFSKCTFRSQSFQRKKTNISESFTSDMQQMLRAEMWIWMCYSLLHILRLTVFTPSVPKLNMRLSLLKDVSRMIPNKIIHETNTPI